MRALRLRSAQLAAAHQRGGHQRVAGVGAALRVGREEHLLVLELQPAQRHQAARRRPHRGWRQPVQRRSLVCGEGAGQGTSGCRGTIQRAQHHDDGCSKPAPTPLTCTGAPDLIRRLNAAQCPWALLKVALVQVPLLRRAAGQGAGGQLWWRLAM